MEYLTKMNKNNKFKVAAAAILIFFIVHNSFIIDIIARNLACVLLLRSYI